jgi:protein TonB
MTAEPDYRKQALIGTVLVHAALIIGFIFAVFKAPNPPLSAGEGVVLNLGFVDEGSGEIQTHNQANDSDVKEEAAPSTEQVQKRTYESEVEAKEELEEVKDTKGEDEDILTGNEETDYKVKVDEAKPQPKRSENKPAVTETRENKASNTDAASNGTVGNRNLMGGNNNGDRPGKTGDQGNPNGDIDSRALYGTPGTGGQGGDLDMPGWGWDERPKVNDPSNENGIIVLRFKVNSDGEVTSIETVESTVSAPVLKLYKDALERTSFTKKSGQGTPSGATGKVTFKIRSR